VQKVEEDLQILKHWSSNSAEKIHIPMFTPLTLKMETKIMKSN
jgi:hypothetical protein